MRHVMENFMISCSC